MRVAFRTLGCKVNQVESEQLKEEFIRQGYEIVDYDREADIYIINTCTVTHTSARPGLKSDRLLPLPDRSTPNPFPEEMQKE
jgi:tRNA A37 methylthiotransferase MiaB